MEGWRFRLGAVIEGTNSELGIALTSCEDDFRPGVQQLIVGTVVSLSLSFIEKVGCHSASVGRPDPDVGLQQEPSARILAIERHTQRLGPLYPLRFGMLVIDRAQKAGYEPRGFPHDPVQGRERPDIDRMRIHNYVSGGRLHTR